MKKYYVIALIVLGLVTHFAFIGHPNETVFDEVHFGKFISGYYTHQYFFDIHPPLGKLMIAGFGKLFHFEPGFSFANIGEKFPDNKYIALRFLPELAGAALPVVVFLVALELGLPMLAALFAGLFVGLDNALLVQSLYILLDAFLLLFGFLGFYFYLRYRNKGNKWNLLGMAVFCGMGASIKWTGLSFLGLAGIMELISFFTALKYRERNLQYWLSELKQLAVRGIFFIAIPFILYFSVFWVHFNLLSHTGPGDAFMSSQFRKTLIGSQDYKDPDIKPLGLWQKFTELNKEMYDSNQRLTATHPYGSPWYTWPLMLRPIFYWIDGNSRIYLIGNPVIWWSSTIAMVMLVLYRGFRQLLKDKIGMVLIGAYVLNMLPFIGVKRVMFLYHYFIALIFAILALAYLVGQNKNARKIFLTLGILALAAFLYFAPLSYGIHLSDAAYNQHVWFSSWR